MIRKTLIFGIVLLLLACSENQEVKEFFSDGKLQSVYTVDKETGLRNGSYSIYHEDGYLYESGTYVNDSLHDERKLLYPSGEPMTLEHYQNGTMHGAFQTFHENGTLEIDGAYTNGSIQGTWKVYYDNGQMKEEVQFRDNEENGPFIEYYENGNLKAKGAYLNGPNEEGELLLYNESGELIRRMDCKYGVCSTTWVVDSTQTNG